MNPTWVNLNRIKEKGLNFRFVLLTPLYGSLSYSAGSARKGSPKLEQYRIRFKKIKYTEKGVSFVYMIFMTK